MPQSPLATPPAIPDLAREWIAAWNSHDLARVLDHYADNIVFKSPMVIRNFGRESGTITNKTDLSAYFAKAFQRVPDLHFDFITCLAGVGSMTVVYRGHGGRLVAEVMAIDAAGKATEVWAHYGPETPVPPDIQQRIAG